jgi:class 3 adenylate cyclase
VTQTLDAGREALDRHAWEEAYQELSAADMDVALEPDDLVRLADAAWWSGHPEEANEALERAYRGYTQANDNVQAAAMALRLSERAQRSLQSSVGQGWLARAERLLEGEPETMVHAWYELMRSVEAMVGLRDLEQAVAHADRAVELGKAHGDPDAVNTALSFKGAALAKMGRVEEALALIDEAATAATSGELGAKAACDVYCVTLATCRDMSDLRRSQEWTERAESYMRRNGALGYPGACKVHRAELKRLQGRWTEAEEEARSACDELARYRLLDVLGDAYNEIGEIRFRLGDLDGAEEAFLKAYESGRDPQPGLALLHLTRGDTAEAAQSIDRSLHSAGGSGYDLLTRVQMLPAKVEIALAVGDMEGALAATEELEQIAAEHENSIWTAAASTARGRLALAEGKTDAAVPLLDAAWRQWRDLDLPYEAARARTSLALARRAAGDESGAVLELRATLSVFEQLGAARDVALVGRLLQKMPAADTSATVTKTFMFTDIITSTDLIGLIGDAAWASLLQWHDRTLEARFVAHGGEVVNRMGDGFFVAFEDPRRAIECAVDVQRTLRAHRAEHGFSPSIRIGIHTSAATKTEGNYTGRGVHVAARVGALGEAGEIVVSATTLDGVGELDLGLSDPRTVTLKGVPEPIEVRGVSWE